MVFLPEAGVRWLVHLMTGHARLRSEGTLTLSTSDSLLLEPAPGERLVLEGSGEALLLRLAPTARTNARAASPCPVPDPTLADPPAPDPRPAPAREPPDPA